MSALAFWTAPRGEATAAWIDDYWGSSQRVYRDFIVQVIGRLNPRTLLEIGSHCGPNIARIKLAHPSVFCYGVDCNSEAVNAGNQRLKALGLKGATLGRGQWPDCVIGGYVVTDHRRLKGFDVALSCYTLAYIEPSRLEESIAAMMLVAKQAVIVEPENGEGQELKRGSYVEWKHDYVAALRRLRLPHKRVRLEPAINGLGQMIVIGGGV